MKAIADYLAAKPVTLTGAQHDVLTLPLREPVLIRGAAGSGKTTVAIYRARHLFASYQDLLRNSKTAIITYNNALSC